MERRGILGMFAGLTATLFGRRSAEAHQAAPPFAPAPTPTPAPATPPNETTARMLAAIPYPRIETSGANALREWERLRREGQGWPVVIGDDEALERIAEQFSIDDPEVFPGTPGDGPADVAAILAAAAKVRVPEDIRKRYEYPGMDPEEMPMPEIGEWPVGTPPAPGLTVAEDILTGKPLGRVHILLLPTSVGAEVPAYLRYGNWNDCPAPEQHVAMLRYWNERYGVELVGLNGDTLNLRIARPPQTREAAMALAEEQYYYCTDIVDQGTQTLRYLAASLVGSRWWFFWWD